MTFSSCTIHIRELGDLDGGVGAGGVFAWPASMSCVLVNDNVLESGSSTMDRSQIGRLGELRMGGKVAGCERIPKVVRIKWGFGWRMFSNPISMAGSCDQLQSRGSAEVAHLQLKSGEDFFELVPKYGRGAPRSIRGRAGGGAGEEDIW